MEEENREELRKKACVHLTLVLFGLLFLIFVFPKLLGFFAPLILAWIIALMANPLVHFLEKKVKIMRKHGSALVIVLVILSIVGLIYFVVSTLASQAAQIAARLPEIYESVVGNIQSFLASLHERYDIVPPSIQNFFSGDEDDKISDYVLTALNSLKSPLAAAGSVAGSFVDILVLSILTIMLSYFFIVNNSNIRKAVGKIIPKSISDSYDIIKNTILKAITGYLKACLQIMMVMFVVLFVFFVIIGVDYAALIALITAVLDFMPFIGTGFVLMPWALYSLVIGEYRTAVLLVAAYLAAMIIRRLIEPKLVGDSVGMSSFETLLSMFIGYRLIGMLGLILGIPIGMAIKVFYEEGVFDRTIRGIKILANDINEYRKF